MSTSPQEQDNSICDRLTKLEELFMHLQRTVQDLDHVIREVQRRLDTLESGVGRVASRIEGLSEDSTASRAAEHERPPHY